MKRTSIAKKKVKRTTTPIKKASPGRLALIKNVEMCNIHLKGKVDTWSNERLLCMAHPSDRVTLKCNL